VPHPTDGISFLPALLGRSAAQKKHDYLYFEYPENGGQVAVRAGNWKGVRTNVREQPRAGWEIYNLSDDPHETKDLSALYPGMAEKFSRIQEKAHQHPHIREWEFVDPKFGKK
jgi:arylsulfatase A-like enzyme